MWPFDLTNMNNNIVTSVMSFSCKSTVRLNFRG